MNFETQNSLSNLFLDALSNCNDRRRRAVVALEEAAKKPSYSLSVLGLTTEPNVGEHIRLLAAVNFKNIVDTQWAPGDSDSPIPIVSDHEKEHIKATIVKLIAKTSSKIQEQLSEAVIKIGKHDFPHSWQSLLPEFVRNLNRLSQENDYVSVVRILEIINSLFKQFRYQFKTKESLIVLKYSLDNFSKPLLDMFKRTGVFIDEVVGSWTENSGVNLKGYIESQRLCCRIFYSLNFMEFPEFFEDHMDEWMDEFLKYLTVKYPEDSDDLSVAICKNISLYMGKEEDLFVEKYLSGFVEAVRALLVAESNSSRLIVAAFKFLTTVVRSVHHTYLFGRAGDINLQQIVESVVISNAMLRQEDEELFEQNYLEFIRRDMEGCDFHSRRKYACEFLKGLGLNYKEELAETVSAQVQSLLASFADNRAANWRQKECAIYLFVSLTTKRAGIYSTDLDLGTFFRNVIAPEMHSRNVNRFPMLKAAALKSIILFRHKISPRHALPVIRHDIIRFIRSDSAVVHSYAALFLEKILQIEDAHCPRYTCDHINTFVFPLLKNLGWRILRNQGAKNSPYLISCHRELYHRYSYEKFYSIWYKTTFRN